MLNRHKIPYAHWSLKVGRFDPATGVAAPVHGEVVFALEDVDQGITDIILTPKRSVPGNPEKGCDLEPYIDNHPAIAIPNITREIWDAIELWEKRAIVDKITVVQIAFSHFVAKILWHPIQSVLDDIQITEVTIRG